MSSIEIVGANAIETTTFRVIISRHSNSDVLLVCDDNNSMLPKVTISKWMRVTPELLGHYILQLLGLIAVLPVGIPRLRIKKRDRLESYRVQSLGLSFFSTENARKRRCRMLELELTSKSSDAIREIETPDGAALLDIRQGICLSMTLIGMMIWHRLKLNQSPAQIVGFLADTFRDVPREQIRDDVVRFVEELRHNGLLISEHKLRQEQHIPKFLTVLGARRAAAHDVRERAGRTPRFLFWKALFGLLVYDLFRFGKSFVRVHAYVRNWPLAHRTVPGNSVDQACKAINHACFWYPKRVLCLQRSAVTTCLLRSYGVPAQMILGAQKVPFKAHAWTEVDTRAINEQEDVRTIYLVWDRC